eukprot:m.78830 g.78830  ORF g.78830 m.78830 type:complete len:69 (-) comp17381_c1_seq2:362-568(-)
MRKASEPPSSTPSVNNFVFIPPPHAKHKASHSNLLLHRYAHWRARVSEQSFLWRLRAKLLHKGAFPFI